MGRSLENRAKFPLACIRAIRENIPEDMPLFMRIGAFDDCLENGMTIEDTIEFCKMAREAGVDVLDVSRGNIVTAANALEVPPIDLKPGFNIDNAARIRRETGMPIIGVGRINTPELAEKILEDDQVDLVVMGRAQLADPEFCNKRARARRTASCIAWAATRAAWTALPTRATSSTSPACATRSWATSLTGRSRQPTSPSASPSWVAAWPAS